MLKNFEYLTEGSAFTTKHGTIQSFFPLYTNALRNRSIRSLYLRPKTVKLLNDFGIHTLHDLQVTTLDQLVEMRQMSLRSLHETVEALYFMYHIK